MLLPEIPQHVLQFIAECIDSVPHLEALLMLRADVSRGWSAAEVAQRLYIPGGDALQILESLVQRGLIVSDGSMSFRFPPDNAVLNERIGGVAEAYRDHLTPLATFIHSKGSAPVREFARAFTLKRDR